MDIMTALRELAAEYVSPDNPQPVEFHSAGVIHVNGPLVFSSPDADEYTYHSDVPHGSHPVYAAVSHVLDGSPAVTAVLIPLASPEAVAAAEYTDYIEDYQPLGPDLGFVWDVNAMAALRPRIDELAEELVERFESTSEAAEAWADVPGDGSSNALAFPVWSESTLCLEGRDEDGDLVALLFLPD